MALQQVSDASGGGLATGRRVAARAERAATRRARAGQVPGGPRWRALLEARWQDRLQKVTELSLAFHDAGSVPEHRSASSLRRLMRRAAAARRDLADTDDALSRLAGGSFGQCEQCSEPIPAAHLFRVPEDRYCPRCA
jgi:RNA polymerase-binding transcription factor DksA